MAHLTRLGLQIPSFTAASRSDDGPFDEVAAVATTAEGAGFDSLWVMDHFFQIPPVGRHHEPMFEAYTLLGGLAARTSRARLGTMVTGVTYRNPALLAKQVTAIDVLSGGRAVLGIGAAWFEKEHEGLGFAFPPLSERFDRLEEALQICRAMFREDAPSFEGRYYRIQDAVNRPRPVQPGGPLILVGGGGERRTLRLVAQYADACNIFGDTQTVKHKLAVLDRHCEELGRDPATITKTRLGTLVIAPSEEDAQRRLAEMATSTGQDENSLRAQLTIGGPDRVVEEAGAFFDAGLDGLVFNMPDVYDHEVLTLAGRTLSDAFGVRGNSSGRPE
ncbi:MAG: LLM class F420-dependent oxidoreductase [Acidimicrobiales bacterium]